MNPLLSRPLCLPCAALLGLKAYLAKQLAAKRLVGGDYHLHPEKRFEILQSVARTGKMKAWHRNAGLALFTTRWVSTLNFPVYNSPFLGIPPTEELRVKHHSGFVQGVLLSPLHAIPCLVFVSLPHTVGHSLLPPCYVHCIVVQPTFGSTT